MENSKSYIDLRILTLSSIGGWVLKSLVIVPAKPLPLNGLTMNRCAVALLACCIGRGSLDIFSRALASPSGYRVRSAPDASARNSLFLEIASWMSVATIGAMIARTIPMTRKII